MDGIVRIGYVIQMGRYIFYATEYPKRELVYLNETVIQENLTRIEFYDFLFFALWMKGVLLFKNIVAWKRNISNFIHQY